MYLTIRAIYARTPRRTNYTNIYPLRGHIVHSGASTAPFERTGSGCSTCVVRYVSTTRQIPRIFVLPANTFSAFFATPKSLHRPYPTAANNYRVMAGWSSTSYYKVHNVRGPRERVFYAWLAGKKPSKTYRARVLRYTAT